MPRRRRSLPRGLYWREGTLYGRVQIAGREYRRCLQTSDVAVARGRLEAERQRLNAEIRWGETDRRWESVVVAWTDHIAGAVGPKTAARYAVSLEQLRPWLTGRRLPEIGKGLVGEIVAGRRKAGASEATIRRDLTALSSVLQFAEANDWHEGNAALTWFRRTKERRDPITLPRPEDVALVLAGAGGMEVLIRAAWRTGCRQDELVRATRRDLDPTRQALTIRRKGNKSRELDVSDCWDLFEALPAGIADAALFPCPGTGGRWKNVASRFAWITRRIEAKREKRDFVRFRFHDLRHLFAVEYLREGRGSIYDLQKHLGHGSVKTTEIYLDFLTPEEAERAKNMHGPAQKPDHGERKKA